MKNLKLTKPLALLLSGLMVTSSFAFTAAAADTDGTNDGNTASSSVVTQSISEVQELMNTISYADYTELYASAPKGRSSVTVNGTDYVAEETDTQVKQDTYGGKNALYTPEEGTVVYNVDIPSDGLYTIEAEYYPITGKASDIERSFRIDGKIPFKESKYLSMTKLWKNDLSKGAESDTGFEQDPNGNDVRPTAYEAPEWMTYDFKDSTGYYNEPFQYYLTAGTHTFSLEATREAVAIGSITFKPYEAPKTYAELQAEYESKGYKAVSSDATQKIQAEFPDAFSSQTIYPTYDRSSAISEPQDPSKIRLNSIGKTTTWQSVGDWVEYSFTAPESGLYKIVTRFQQSEQSDMFVSRKLLINGELPFAEAGNLEFAYNDRFQTAALNDGDTEFTFYFEAGQTYTLRFEIVLGHMAQLISEIEASLTNLNAIYLKIKQITGATPDNYRDYNFIELIPDELNLLIKESDNLYDFSRRLEEITGERGSNCGTLNNIARIANLMGRDEDEIARNLTVFKTNLGTLGTWMNTARTQPLQIDYISIQSADAAIPKATENAFQAIAFEFQQFIASFYTDYNSLGSEESGEQSIDVWVTTGRDQSQIVRQMINDMFTPEYGVPVNLKLVAAGTLLPATLAGEGPDVAYMGGSDPINYAIRSAIQKLDGFDTFDEVVSRFNKEALIPFTLDVQDNPETPDKDESEAAGVYAIPETQSFSMLFYRQDIFADLGIEVPTTWAELKAILPVLQSQYMDIAMPQSLAGFTLLYYQRNGDLYADGGMRINLDSNLALDTFKELCDMFTQYKFPLTFDFANRFRTGDMPIGIADYSTYTQLNAFATEIKGRWTMTTLPGYEMTDENGNTYINNTSTTTVSGLVMMRDDERSEAQTAAAWKYIDWITSAAAQARYGNEYSALLGNGTIHVTANMEAMRDMNWSSSELTTLLAQFSNLKATPEYPGSYIVTRYVDFAFLAAYNNNADPVESMLKQYIYINKEITRKREEFGLETLELGQTLEEKRAAENNVSADD
ncbi:MAG: extracellular solute-binding protein [Clostridia bacterium]|nr:extracellular solute-binding protein [Clostridia bacterium]